MTVYVDDMQRLECVGTIRARWSHLFADTSDELHAFAAGLGLKRQWVQHAGTYREHYDVTDARRSLALELGAKPLKYPRETGEFIKARRALDVIAEPDRRRAEHMNRTLRLAEGGDGEVIESLRFIGKRHGGSGQDPLVSTCACLQGKPCLCPCHRSDQHTVQP